MLLEKGGRASLLAGIALLSILAVAQADVLRTTNQASSTVSVDEMEKRLLKAFADDLLALQMEKWKVPGAVVALVADGEVVLLEGYGFADLAALRRVDAKRTVFHVASISKALTATALLQLSEQGRLDLHQDVNRYLTRFRVEPTFPRPVTTHHLLTHSAGFDERSIDRKSRIPTRASLADYLERRMPPRVRPPGLVSVYSNHGYALAGLLVEEISGQPFETYLKHHLFRPLGMNRTSFKLTPAIERGLATGYDGQGTQGQASSLDHIRTAPASMLLTTGADLAHWMIALLDGGTYQGRRILRPSSAALQLSRQFSNHPLLPGRSYGLNEGSRFEPPEFLHAGGASGFTSALVLVPHRRVGLFVAFNSRTHIWETVNRLLDRLQEDWGSAPRAPSPEPVPLDSSRFAGYYRDAQLAETTVEGLASLILQDRIETAGDNRIVWRSQTFEAIDPLAFRRVDGAMRLAFVEQGGLVRFLSAAGTVQVKVRWYEAQPVQLGLWALFTAIFLLLALSPLGTDLPGRRRRLEPQDAFRPRWLLALARAAGISNLLFLVTLFALLAWALNRGGDLEYGVPASLFALLAIPLLAGALTLAAAVGLVLGWLRGYWTRGTRLRFTVAVLALLAFLPFLASWNLLGFHL